MKRLLLLLSICGYLSSATAQTVTDPNGDKVYRGNIAVFVQENKYVFDTKKPQQESQAGTPKANTETATYAWVMKILQDEGFRVVNRDSKLSQDVKTLINEQKSEDYLDGFTRVR